jgi:hypothetical protein
MKVTELGTSSVAIEGAKASSGEKGESRELGATESWESVSGSGVGIVVGAFHVPPIDGLNDNGTSTVRFSFGVEVAGLLLGSVVGSAVLSELATSIVDSIVTGEVLGTVVGF